MAKKSADGVNKSEEVRQLLKANPALTVTAAREKMAEKGIKISNALFYYTKGKIKGRKSRKTKKAQRAATKVAATTHVTITNAVSTIKKVKGWASEVGGMKTLKALVEALSE